MQERKSTVSILNVRCVFSYCSIQDRNLFIMVPVILLKEIEVHGLNFKE